MGALLQAVLDQIEANNCSRGQWKVDLAGHPLGRLRPAIMLVPRRLLVFTCTPRSYRYFYILGWSAVGVDVVSAIRSLPLKRGRHSHRVPYPLTSIIRLSNRLRRLLFGSPLPRRSLSQFILTFLFSGNRCGSMRFIRLPDRLAVPAFGVSPCEDTFNLAMRNAILTRIFYTAAPILVGHFTTTVVQMDLNLIVERYQASPTTKSWRFPCALECSEDAQRPRYV